MVLELWSKDTKKKTVFFVTHDVDEALILATRIFVLGQSPSHVIYECTLEQNKKRSRTELFENPELIEQRNTLIRYINRDIENRIGD